MKDIGADLLAIQQYPDPVATVAVYREGLPIAPGGEVVRWSVVREPAFIALDEGEFWNTAPLGVHVRSDGQICRLRVNDAGALVVEILADMDAWTGAAPVAVATLASGVSVREVDCVHNGTVLRACWLVEGVGLYVADSADEGDSWGAAVLVPDSDVVWGDLQIRVNVAEPVFAWAIVATGIGYPSGKHYQIIFLDADGSGAWARHYNAPPWNLQAFSKRRSAGAHQLVPGEQMRHYSIDAWSDEVVSLREGGLRGTNPSYVWSGDAEWYVHQVHGGQWGVHLRAVRAVEALGMDAFIVIEGGKAEGWYVGLSARLEPLEGAAGVAVEPRMLYGKHRHMIDRDRCHLRVWEVGGVTYLGDAGGLLLRADPVVYDGGALEPVRYQYHQQAFQAGWMELVFSATVTGLETGQLLRVERRYERDGRSGAVSLWVWAAAVTREADRVTVFALDALGYLGHWRARRPTVLTYTASLNKLAKTIHAVATLAGLSCYVDYAGARFENTLPLSIQGGENALGAIWRSMTTALACLAPSPDGFGVDLVPTWSQMGGLSSYRGRGGRMPYAYGEGEHPHTRAAKVDDVRNFGQVYVVGAEDASALSSESGSAIGWDAVIAPGPVRPAPMAVRDSRTWIMDGALDAQVRIMRLQWPALELEATANLGLELFSTVRVTDPWVALDGEVFRVVRLIETWNRGVLKQHVYGVREEED